MQNNYKAGPMYYLNLIARKLQNALITTPELGFVFVIVVGIIILFIFAKLFIRLP